MRIQHWALTLSAYKFKIEYRKSELMGLPDTLSRLPLPEFCIDTVGHLSVPYSLPLNSEIIAAETIKDSVFSTVLACVKEDRWPPTVDSNLKPYFDVRYVISVHNNCLVFGDRVCVPPSLRTRVLDLLHDGHPGSSRMKMRAKLNVWWPNINQHIDQHVAACEPCAIFLLANRNTPCTTTGLCPSQLVTKNVPRTNLTVLKPPILSNVSPYFPKAVPFEKGDKVLVKQCVNSPVVHGTILQALGPMVYEVLLPSGVTRCLSPVCCECCSQIQPVSPVSPLVFSLHQPTQRHRTLPYELDNTRLPHSDSGIWSKCSLKPYLEQLNIPPTALPGTNDLFPYVVVGDEGFPLSQQVLIPFPKDLVRNRMDRRIFNYRLSRARRCSENSFGLLVARFQIFRSAMRYDPGVAKNVILATFDGS
ncbi:hypothetical protein KUF71_019515 [Frankliniella fusca]|uniref:RNA-directed DNA polymerase n=1 Tax=Frankliniella fusca TaxID=407009 RepID=A0AAE1HY30_9NEOP|nr:hypothetical protein KUF71_019515 [Frankliniella fusca]